ncbi:hypothetical protein V6N13_087938 [Hibiscus sabdariffa]
MSEAENDDKTGVAVMFRNDQSVFVDGVTNSVSSYSVGFVEAIVIQMGMTFVATKGEIDEKQYVSTSLDYSFPQDLTNML